MVRLARSWFLRVRAVPFRVVDYLRGRAAESSPPTRQQASVPGESQQAGTVIVKLSPDALSVHAGESFDITVVLLADRHRVTTVAVCLAFDPSCLCVAAAPSAGPSLVSVSSQFDNRAGTVTFGGFFRRPSTSGSLTVCTLHLQAVGLTGASSAAIAPHSLPRSPVGLLVVTSKGTEPRVTWGGDGSVTVLPIPGDTPPLPPGPTAAAR